LHPLSGRIDPHLAGSLIISQLAIRCACRTVQDKLVKIAKKLKKNNVAVDVVSFGSEEDNQVRDQGCS
jgi:hypothetical protein